MHFCYGDKVTGGIFATHTLRHKTTSDTSGRGAQVHIYCVKATEAQSSCTGTCLLIMDTDTHTVALSPGEKVFAAPNYGHSYTVALSSGDKGCVLHTPGINTRATTWKEVVLSLHHRCTSFM
jgi:hypothetical protein